MHYAISTTWGPSDTTRAAIPFIFAATALEAGDTVTMILFHDAVSIAVPGAHERIVPCGPPAKFKEVFESNNVDVIVCKPCADVRGITEADLPSNCRMGGMGDFYKQVSREDCKPIAF
ncbi:DsrE family protein [Marinimicrobium sp. ABcell2]|uniref:DsrE family protein n=1 Tax=Marinimicrobium sp. ABcell2 TaxID=3069751 RepID=UPI0027B7C7EE|nr:DsrE family protein [Marinimicrobium sp. ABcell2]MDQ2076779.1 DsrE family protein [Marinimicrobium sp. ABcell2]